MKRKLFSILTASFKCAIIIFIVSVNSSANAQSKDFKTAKNLEIQYNILRELSQKYVDTVNLDKLVNKGIEAMLQSLDPYTEYIPDEDSDAIELMTTATYGGVGALINKQDSAGVLISEPYLNSPASKNGLEPGDIILKINGEDIIPLNASESSDKMKGQPGTEVKFLVKKGRTGETKEIKITRERIHISDLSFYGILEGEKWIEKNDSSNIKKIGYLKLDGFTVNGSKEVKNAVQDLKNRGADKLVLDLRGNGGGLMEEAINIISLFVPKGTEVVSQMGRDSSSLIKYKTLEEPIDTIIPLLVLVNSGSASSSEIVAGSLQDLDRATIAGTRTFGKGLIQLTSPVGYNGVMKFTIAKYYIPSGRCIQAIDYEHRNEDGSVGAVPDSLKKAFKTKNGRIVYDGGGITPDIEIKSQPYSRQLVSLVFNNIINDYAIEYYKKHDSIAKPDVFKLSDSDYEEFIKFASSKNFDTRSSSQILLEQMIKSAKSEDLYNINKEELESLEKKFSMTKEQTLKIKRAEIQPVIEQEIVTKYYYTPGRIETIIQSDEQLHKAIQKSNNYKITF
jgi:C-terminal peptidase (prc)